MVLWIIALCIWFYFAVTVGYLFVLSLAGRLFYRNPWTAPGEEAAGFRRIAVLVPSYKEDGIIVSTAENLLAQTYPSGCYDVHIIADSLQEATLERLRNLPVFLWEVSFPKSTKTRSLNAFFKRNKQEYDLALVCDADNMLDGDFLYKVNLAFDRGARAVQGCRVPKNFDTPFAVLDGCSEAIGNHLFRKGAAALGLTSSVIGSGMVFEYAMLSEILASIDAVGGFDKILQLKVTEAGIPIRYLEDALIFDEKVGTPEAFGQQRKRWVSSQFVNLKQYFVNGFVQLFRGNPHYFSLAVAGNVVLPRAFLLVLLPVLAGVSFLVAPSLGCVGIAVWVIYMATLAIALPPVFYRRRELREALLHLPRAVWMMLLTVFHLGAANKTFIHTVHTKTNISNNLFKQQHGG